jgi:hypothetical protein
VVGPEASNDPAGAPRPIEGHDGGVAQHVARLVRRERSDERLWEEEKRRKKEEEDKERLTTLEEEKRGIRRKRIMSD